VPAHFGVMSAQIILVLLQQSLNGYPHETAPEGLSRLVELGHDSGRHHSLESTERQRKLRQPIACPHHHLATREGRGLFDTSGKPTSG
jgi:hypothetical protein